MNKIIFVFLIGIVAGYCATLIDVIFFTCVFGILGLIVFALTEKYKRNLGAKAYMKYATIATLALWLGYEVVPRFFHGGIL